MYKWVDEKGTVHFSNTAPPANAKLLNATREIIRDPVLDPMESEMKIKRAQSHHELTIQARKARLEKEKANAAEISEDQPPKPQLQEEEQPLQPVSGPVEEPLEASVEIQPAEEIFTIHDLQVFDAMSELWGEPQNPKQQ